ncbi:MAG: PQQ-binding-like beta-propeller repeat protein [Bacteroidia bacterium]|nr:PQQ-binding-like beta-propeller repeat protein [Bacteroidia bacterium]
MVEIFNLSGQKKVTIAFLADLHVNPDSYTDSALNRIVDEINAADFDFTIVAGDLTNTGSDAELSAVKRALDKLLKPYHVIPGNHETNWSESAGLTFDQLWGDDRFYFRFENFTFIGFNTGPFMRMGDGLVKQEDLYWLKRKLGGSSDRDNVLISFSHYPLSDGLSDWPEVTDILRSANCRLSFCGHGHQLSLFNFNGIPGIMGRSVLMGNSRVPGYNIIRISGDSVYVFNKVLGKAAGNPSIRLNYMKPDTLSGIPVSPLPDFSMNKSFPGIKAVTLLTDTASIFTGPCLVNDTILIYANSLGWVKGINTKSQKVLWQFRIAGPVYSTPVNCRGVVVMGSVDGNIIGIKAINGKVLWRVFTGRPVLAEGIAEGDFVCIGGGDKTFYKINALNGNILWQFNDVGDLMQGSPALSETAVIFGAWDRHLYCLDKNTGMLKWKWNNGKPQKLYSPGNISPVLSNGKVFIVAPDRYMTALDLKTGKEIWRTNKHQVRESMGISMDGSLIYAKLMNDTLVAVSASENYPVTKWAVNGGFGYEHNPCPVMATENTVIAATRSGVLVAIDPDIEEVKWKYKAGNSSVNMVLPGSNGKYWFTLMEGKIIEITMNNL